MVKRICSVLCTWLLIGVMLVYGAKGSNLTEVRHSTENRNLTEKSNTVKFEKGSEPEMPKVTEETEVAEATEMTESDAEQLDWKQAYLAKAEEMEAAGHPLKYDLIYLDANDIPELVAAPTKGGFYLYTWKDGKVCELMNCKGLTDGEYGYEAYQGIIGKNVNTTGHTLYLSVTEKTEKASSYVKGRWLVLAGRYDLSTLSSLLEQQVDLWEQEEWGQGEWKQEEWKEWGREELVLEGLDQKTLKSFCYTDADGKEFYITEEKALQEAAALLGELRGISCVWEPDWWHTEQHNYCTIEFTTTDDKRDYIVYEGSNLHRNSGNRGFQMQDDFEEILAKLFYFISTDYLLSLVESEEGRQTIQGILDKEDSQLVRLVVNQVEDLNYCLFETSEGQGLEFHLFLWGSWEDKEVQQYQIFSLNEEYPYPLDQLSEECEVTKEDIDFDSRPDLLIFEGRSHDVKNTFYHYRVMRWDEVQGQFVYYPSFPFWIFYMNLEDKQVIYKAKDGALDRIVRIYEVVEGEYRVTQEMHLSTESVPEEYRGKTPYLWLEILSYYEDGELVWECDVSGMSWDEMEEPCRKRGLSEIFSYTRDYG